jgi:hypothetical protein
MKPDALNQPRYNCSILLSHKTNLNNFYKPWRVVSYGTSRIPAHMLGPPPIIVLFYSFKITFPTKITLGDIQLSQMPLNSDYNKARHYHGLCISIDERELGCVDGIYDEDYETYDDYAVSNILTFEVMQKY